MPSDRDNGFSVVPRRLDHDDWHGAQWSVYLIRLDLAQHGQQPALKVGMVGSGTVGARMRSHDRQFGPTEILSVWSVAHAAEHLEVVAAWRLTEQYEARLQFAPEFQEPSARLRRLRPEIVDCRLRASPRTSDQVGGESVVGSADDDRAAGRP